MHARTRASPAPVRRRPVSTASMRIDAAPSTPCSANGDSSSFTYVTPPSSSPSSSIATSTVVERASARVRTSASSISYSGSCTWPSSVTYAATVNAPRRAYSSGAIERISTDLNWHADMDFTLPDELRALQDEATELALEVAADRAFPEAPRIVGHDATFSKELGARGWLGMTWPVEDGGHGRTVLERFIVFEALIANGAPVAASWFADRQMGPSLLQFGTAEQRRRWIPGIVAGESMWCIGMSEPDAGSDVASLRTRAVRDGNEWVIDGQKVWTSGAAFSDWCYLIARTDPDAPKHAALSEFVVDMHAPGVTVRPIVDMTSNNHFCEVMFEGVRVPADHLVGEENNSFRQLMRQMEHERGGIDRLVSNYALYRDVMTSGFVDHDDPLVRQELAAIETSYRIG